MLLILDPLIGFILSFSLILIVSLGNWYRYRNQKQENDKPSTQFYQSGGIEGLFFILIIFGIIGLILQQSGKKGELNKANTYLESQQYSQALEIFLKRKQFDKAVESIVKSPQGTQIILLRQLQGQVSKARLKTLFLQLGDRLQSENASLAASAYNLAELPWKAAQTFILNGQTQNALDILSTSSIFSNDKERATRNLAKFAYEHNKVLESAELLEYIGAEDEAVAVLVAAGRTADDLNRLRVSNANDHQSSVRSASLDSLKTPHPDDPRSSVRTSPYVLLHQQISKAQGNLRNGRFNDAESILKRASALTNKLPLSDSDETKNLKQELKRTQESVRLFQAARTAFKQRRIEDAQVSFSELLDYAGDLFSAEIFAEAGLAYEQNPVDHEAAKEYYLEAAKRASTDQARLNYEKRAQGLQKGLTDLPAVPADATSISETVEIQVNPKDPCVVCKRPVGHGQTAQCHHCKSVAHYPHMAEWLKIKGTCPVCKQKLN